MRNENKNLCRSRSEEKMGFHFVLEFITSLRRILKFHFESCPNPFPRFTCLFFVCWSPFCAFSHRHTQNPIHPLVIVMIEAFEFRFEDDTYIFLLVIMLRVSDVCLHTKWDLSTETVDCGRATTMTLRCCVVKRQNIFYFSLPLLAVSLCRWSDEGY